MPKVMTIVGTRPEIIKMSCVIKEFDKYVKHVLVHTGQNFDYELNQIFFKDLGLRNPDYYLNAVGKTTAQTIGLIISKVDEVFNKENPDAVLLYGDTNSCLSVIAAKRKKIPVFHMEAGNRCYDERVPEELNRKILDHLSDINFVLTEHARRYLISEGINQEMIIKTGSHMREVLKSQEKKIKTSSILKKLNLKKNKYFVFSAHREENLDDLNNFTDMLDSMNALAEIYKIPIVVTTHPRTKKKIEELENINMNNRIKFLKPFGFSDYIKLQKEAFCVLSDSGTITEESDLLDVPAINIRNAHERPEGMDEGTLIMSGLKKEDILRVVEIITDQFKSKDRKSSEILDYKPDNVSKKILRVVLSNIKYINRKVWSKQF